MTREYDRQMLESITQSFTKDQATEFSRRIQAVHTLLDRVSPKCEELASEIRKRREAEKSSRYFLAFLLITVVVLLILRSLSVVNYDAFFSSLRLDFYSLWQQCNSPLRVLTLLQFLL